MVETVTVKVQGSATGAHWWRSPHWRKAPFVLWRHRSALAAVAAAGLLVSLAASSGPLVTTAAASSALKDELSDLTPFATGVQITGLSRTNGRLAPTLRAANDPRASRSRPRQPPGAGSARVHRGDRPSAHRDDERRRRSPQPAGANRRPRPRADPPADEWPGVWVSDATARIAHLAPGGILRLRFSEHGVGDKSIALRVKGVYRALDATTPGPYWVHFQREIVPPGVDPPPPVRYVLADRDELYRHRPEAQHSPDGQGSRAGVSLRRRPARHDDGGAGG